MKKFSFTTDSNNTQSVASFACMNNIRRLMDTVLAVSILFVLSIAIIRLSISMLAIISIIIILRKTVLKIMEKSKSLSNAYCG